MIITLQFDTAETLSDEDKAILRALKFMDDEGSTPAPAAPAKATKKAAKKAAAEPADDSAALRDKALTVANGLLAKDEREKVKDALEAVGAERVSKVGDDRLQEFIDLLNA